MGFYLQQYRRMLYHRYAQKNSSRIYIYPHTLLLKVWGLATAIHNLNIAKPRIDRLMQVWSRIIYPL